MSSSTQQDATFNFLALPPELRNRVYYYAFSRFPSSSASGTQPKPTCLCFLCPAGQCSGCNTNLLSVCRQIRLETLPIYYSTHLFILWLHPSAKTPIVSWTDSLASSGGIQYLRRLRFDRLYREKEGNWHPSMALVEVNLNSDEGGAEGCVSVTCHDQAFRAKKCEEVVDIVRGLPRTGRNGGQRVLSMKCLLKIIEVVRWNCGGCTGLECDGGCSGVEDS